MMTRTLQILLTGLLLCGLLVSASSHNAQDNTLNPVKWSLKLEPANKSFQAGARFKAQLIAQIEDGWHLYALDEIPNGPRPTRITLPEDQAFTLAGDIEQPTPIVKFDENFGVETQYFAETATFQAPLKVSSSAKSGATKLLMQVRYQTCNERLCLPPKTVKVEAKVEIK